MIPGFPPVGWGGWMGMEGGERVHPTHVHIHAHAHMCMHRHMCMTSYGIPRDFPNGGSHLHEITMFTTHACTCMCTCVGGTPQPPPTAIHPPPYTHPHPPEPQEAENTKIQ